MKTAPDVEAINEAIVKHTAAIEMLQSQRTAVRENDKQPPSITTSCTHLRWKISTVTSNAIKIRIIYKAFLCRS